MRAQDRARGRTSLVNRGFYVYTSNVMPARGGKKWQGEPAHDLPRNRNFKPMNLAQSSLREHSPKFCQVFAPLRKRRAEDLRGNDNVLRPNPPSRCVPYGPEHG